jgi:hypothetical protein
LLLRVGWLLLFPLLLLLLLLFNPSTFAFVALLLSANSAPADHDGGRCWSWSGGIETGQRTSGSGGLESNHWTAAKRRPKGWTLFIYVF